VALVAGAAVGDADLFVAGESASATAVLARDAAQWNRDLRGVVVPLPAADVFAAEWAARTGRVAQFHVGLREYALTALAISVPARHAMRRALRVESALLQDWQEAFVRELGISEEMERARARQAQLIERGQLWLLVDADDAPLCMVGYNEVPPRGARIAPVYTPGKLRRQGLAGELVARLCRDLLARGLAAIYLAADTANPISNALYQRIGFRVEGDHTHFLFVDPDPA